MRRREFISGAGGALGAVAWPLSLRGQPNPPVVGFMSSRAPEDSANLVAAFQKGLREGGLVEGRNVVVEYRWGHGDYSRLPALAAELVNRPVAVLTAVGGEASVRAAKQATATIPIVFSMGSDPVAIGLVKSLNRPGGNVTGINVLASQMETKRLGLLHELVPDASTIGALLNEKFPPAANQLQQLDEAARTLKQRMFIAKAGNDAELNAAFAALVQQHVGALLVAADPYFDTRRERIIAFAAEHRLPAMYQFREYAEAGGLVSYGIGLAEGYREVGGYAARIVKGEKPAELPVQLVTKFELIINLKTAKTLGFEFPPTFSARADEVIE
jgi:putative ABC transport system substrate-binding protein